MRCMRYVLILLGLSFLVGCAKQPNVPLADNFWQDKKQKIAVVTTKSPTPHVYQTGGEGLLDYAINSVANNGLGEHLSSTDLTWYRKLPQNFVTRLKQSNVYAQAYDEQPKSGAGHAQYFSFARLQGADKLLLIDLEAVGVQRSYYSFVPTGDPKAYCVLKGELIDTNNNQVLWRYKSDILQPIQGNWDQSPNYPNLTHALENAEALAEQEMIASFFSGH